MKKESKKNRKAKGSRIDPLKGRTAAAEGVSKAAAVLEGADLGKSGESEEGKAVPENMSPEAELARIRARTIIVCSFAALGFFFAFLSNYGFFEMDKALLYGLLGAVVGGAVGYSPYFFSSFS